ncbi:hypothetical protein Hypma_000127 [Hypsizygus marmoreus]|uniref:Alcohol dehydrogenase-like C-terminal domain-containing protein n=1 Tax=Hypsizygus marmoreus TaxID=39966 RepID=A0A369K8W0_HYPMA|nr:hypothetical protein Hypma_000127 [Hypsizygus marmoreus]
MAETILVWGVASSTGPFAIQAASQAGYRVVTTASTKHTSYLQSLGASAVISYTLPSTTLLSTLQSHGHYTAYSAPPTPPHFRWSSSVISSLCEVEDHSSRR